MAAIQKILILSLVLSSCVTQKKCFEKFPPDTVTIVRDTIIYRDTTIYRHLPGDTVYISRIFNHTDTIYHPYKPISLETDLCAATTFISSNRLKMRLIQKDSVFRFKLDSAIRANKHTKIITRVIEKPVPPKPFYKIGFFILAVLMLLTILFLILFK